MKKLRVFISYSRKDIQAAEMIQREIEDVGFDVWRDVADIEPAENWSRETAKNLANNDIIVLLWSRNAAASPAVRHEWLTARALEKGIIPCFLEPMKDLPSEARLPQPLKSINDIHFDDFGSAIGKLLRTLKNPCFIQTKYDYTQLPPHSFIPLRPNPDFVGRHSELLELYLAMIEGPVNGISGDNNVVVGISQLMSVFGLGGIGKTQMAVEFAYRFAYAFPEGIWWLNAAEDWKSEFAALGRELRLSTYGASSAEDYDILLPKLRNYISEHKSMLLIMDNVADPSKLGEELVKMFVPTTLGCSLLFTSRSRELPTSARSLEVKILDNEATYHLLTTQNPPASEDEKSYAREICSIMGNLPLALRMAGTYLREKKCVISYQQYQQNILKHGMQVLEERLKGIGTDTGHDSSLIASFESQYDLLEDESARNLFKLAGQLPEAGIIPIARLGLLAGIEDHYETLETPLDNAIKHLIKISLVEQLWDNRVRLHPLVREFAQSLIPSEERGQFQAIAANCLQAAYEDPLRLGREYTQRGVDSVIDDVQVGIDWSESNTICEDKLSQLKRLLDQERHNLKIEKLTSGAPKIKARLFQQLHYRAHNMGMSEVADKFIAAMYTSAKTCFKSRGQQSLGDPAWLRTFKGHPGAVMAVSFSPDGKRAISGSSDKTLILWDIESGKPIRTFEGHSDLVSAVGFSPDGKQVISGSSDKTLILWNIERGKRIRILEGHSGGVIAVSFSPDGKRAISGSRDKTLILWNIKSGKRIRTFEGHSGGVMAVGFSPDGKQIISGSWDKTLILWDIKSGKRIRTFEGHSASVRVVSFSPDGKQAISGSRDKSLILWDIESGKIVRTLKGHSGWVRAVSFSPDGKQVISGSGDKTLILWDIESGERINIFKGHSDWVSAVSFSPDGKRAISGSGDKTLILWNIGSGKHSHIIEGHSSWVRDVSFSPDGKRVISCSDDKTLILWNMESGKSICTFKGHSDWVSAVSFSPDGKQAISGSGDKTLILWDMESRKRVRTFKGHSGWVRAVSCCPDGKQVISGSSDERLILWDIKSGKRVRTFKGHSGWVRAVDFSPDGKQAISGSDDETIILWDIESGKRIRTFEGHSARVMAVSFSPDGKQAISGSWDKTLILWDIEGGKRIRTFEGHSGWVRAISFSPDGKRAISGSQDKMLILWDIAKGCVIHELHTNSNIVCLSWMGAMVAFGDNTGLVQFLEIIN